MKVIIVEDEAAHLELMERALRREFPDVQIYSFEEIASCLNALDGVSPDVIITDYRLPDGDGLRILEELRMRSKDTPVVVVTGQGDERVAVNAMKLGAYDYLAKSGDFFSLVPNIIQRAMREQSLKRALQESQALYERESNSLKCILASMRNPLVVIREDLTIGLANSVFESTFGADLVGKPYHVIFGESHDLAVECRKAVEDGYAVCMEFDDSRNRSWQVSVSPGIGYAGETIGGVLVFQDISKHRTYETELQHLSDRMIHVQEEERTRISRELHDELGQVLTALKFDAAWLKDNIPEGMTDVRKHLDGMFGLIDGLLSAVRRISSDLRPGILDHVGLGAAIEWYAAEFERRSGIECLPLLDLPEKRLTGYLETGIYRIVQEALTNVARHARASVVTISAKQDKHTLFLQVDDDGIGIDPEKIRSPLSTGILSMRERAEILSGRLDVTGTPGEGTTINVQVPIVYR